jgi:hypothetical protein
MTLVFSIGHSNHDWGTFKRLLETANIGTVADVRSSPASRLPHFNRAALKDRLNATGIAYIFLGSELGGRPKDGGRGTLHKTWLPVPRRGVAAAFMRAAASPFFTYLGTTAALLAGCRILLIVSSTSAAERVRTA